MNRKIKLTIILFLLTISIFSLTACYNGDNVFDPIGNGYNVIVSYDCLGGAIGGNEIRTVHSKPGSPILEPKGETGLVEPKRTNFVLDGWYKAYTGSRDKPVFNEADRFNFAIDLGLTSMTLYAKWVKLINIEWWIPQSDSPFFTMTYKSETLINQLSDALSPTKTGYSFAGKYYTDEALTTLWDFTTMKTPAESAVPIKIYAKMIEGTYAPIRTLNELKLISENKNYILFNDIDLGAETWTPLENYGAQFNGNGFAIKNLKISVNNKLPKNYGFFAKTTNAKIYDLKILNANIAVSGNPAGKQIYGILIGMAQGTTEVTNCVLTGNIKTTLNGQDSNNLVYGKVIGFSETTVRIINTNDDGVNLIR